MTDANLQHSVVEATPVDDDAPQSEQDTERDLTRENNSAEAGGNGAGPYNGEVPVESDARAEPAERPPFEPPDASRVDPPRPPRRTRESVERYELAQEIGDGADAEVSDLLDVLNRNLWLIVAIVAIAMLVGWLLLSRLTPLYTARADVLIEAQRPQLATLEAVLPVLGIDDQSIVSETVVLTSGVLLEAVVDRLDLVNDPEFNSALGPPTGVDRIFGLLGLEPEPVAAESRRPQVLNALANSLDIRQVPDSRVISVLVTSESSTKAAEIANTIVDEYLQAQQRRKVQASSETSTWLESRIAELQTQLQESEQRVEDFRSQADLLEAGGATLISQRLADLSAQLVVSRSSTAASRARLTNLLALVDSPDSSQVFSSGEVLQSPLIQELRRQQVALQREEAELSSEFGPAHPRMVQLRADAADLRTQIDIEVDKVIQALRNEVAVAEARDAELERQVAALTSRMGQTNEDEIQLRALEREADANRQLLETLLGRQKELGSPAEQQTAQSDARVTSFAAAPLSPSFPKMGISLAAIFVVSTILALVVAFVREIRRKGFVSLEQLEATTQLTVLGFVPLVTSRRQKRNMLESIVTDPGVPFSQALKTLNWQLDDTIPKKAQVILVTSAEPSEGKTTTAIGLARTKALKGQKTLIIDADIRNPSVHDRLECAQSPGLRDAVERHKDIRSCISFDRVTSLDILPAGEASVEALNLVDSTRMDSILAELVDKYEYIIIDSPPIAAAPDACALSKIADTTILTVRWMDTSASALKYALRILRRNGGHLTGTVLTMVDTSKPGNRSYGYFGYYGSYGQYGEKAAV